MNENVGYELFVKKVYESIISNEGYENIEVNHNVKIKGKSGCNHQIDVYWEFKIAGEVKRFAIECKNYSNTIEISKVRDFFGVVYDIGDIKGIMVTKKGYQSGAKLFADFHGVSLKEIRQPIETDWNGRLRKMQFKTYIIDVQIKDFKLYIDESWLIDNVEEFDKSKIEFSSNVYEEVIIYNEDGKKDFDIGEMVAKLPISGEKGKDLRHELDFSKEMKFVETSIGKIKVVRIIVVYNVNQASSEVMFDAMRLTSAIFKDAQSGEMKFI